MSTPILWIFVPALMGLVLFFLRRWYRTTVLIGTLTSLVLAIGAILIPINELVHLGPLTFKLSDTLVIFGRRLFLNSQDRPLVILIYILVGFWFSAAFEARAGRMFVPIGLVLVAVWIAALAVEPFLFAALLLELAILLSIPMLSPPGRPPGRGVIRYLIFQTFGMPFILLTGWLLAGVESSPGDTALVTRATILLGFGFIFWLGIFPFHSWLPMMTEEGHPYSISFIFFFLPLMVLLFGLNFLNQYAWLRQSSSVYEALRIGGVIMMLVGGAWAALQSHLGRILGFAILTSTGASLLAISAVPTLELFFAMQIPRALALAVWALGLSVLRKTNWEVVAIHEPDTLAPTSIPKFVPEEAFLFKNIQGMGLRLPLATAAITLATLSFAGYPLLAGFPIFQALWRNLATSAPFVAVLALLGCTGLGIGGLRSLSILVMGLKDSSWHINENWLTATFLIIGILLMISIGLFPHWTLPYAASISNIFSQLKTPSIMP